MWALKGTLIFYPLNFFIADGICGTNPKTKPHAVHKSALIVGLNIPKNSMALLKHGSLQEKHMVVFQLKHFNISISNMALMFFFLL